MILLFLNLMKFIVFIVVIYLFLIFVVCGVESGNFFLHYVQYCFKGCKPAEYTSEPTPNACTADRNLYAENLS